jgi:protein gp37
MLRQSGIEWTDVTWNPSTGCSKVSSGCKFCYAETFAKRLQGMGNARYRNGFGFTIHWDKIQEPLQWKKPRKVFVNSMSDLFHEQSSLSFIGQIVDVMMQTPQHRYQVLTKRPDRMAAVLTELLQQGRYRPVEHIWVGTSVESQHVVHRLAALKEVPASIRFLSCEPLLGKLSGLDLTGIHWVIVGGESGAHLWHEQTRSRRALVDYVNGKWLPKPERIDWVRDLRDTCLDHRVAFFFKQWGGHTPKAGGRTLDGTTWNDYPGPSQSQMSLALE